ncbi:MAG: hypothetical protein SGI88_10515 [Candidatus Hydrogenedentes bacterium]|nr:hypothetical protein [Candidatus Hydrogenedentota bacterium]
MRRRVTPRPIDQPAKWTSTDRFAVKVALAVSLLATVLVVVAGIFFREPNAATAIETTPQPILATVAPPEAAQPESSPAHIPDASTDFVLTVAAATPAPDKPDNSTGPLTIRPSDNIILKNVTRFGLNIGARTTYGAAQHLKNIVPNPGFESGVFASMIHSAKGATASRVPQAFWDTDWTRDDYGIGQPKGFWDGGEYEFLYGAAKGRSGRITRFALENHENIFYLDGGGPAPSEWDVLVVRRELPGIASGPRMDTASVVMGDVPPGSPGTQSLRITPGDQGRFIMYLDSLWRDGDKSAGKLLRVRGDWKIEFWAKSLTNAGRIRVFFGREGEGAFFDEMVPLTSDWQKIERTFAVADDADKAGPYAADAYHPLLTIGISVENPGGEILIDDATIEPDGHTNPTPFTDTFVNRLKELQPGVLRNWSSQHGDTLENQVSEPFARKTNGYNPRQRAAGEWGFSLHEFLQLCQVTGAEPWYVMPPMWSATEVRQLMEYLAAPANSAHPFAQRRANLGQQAPWTEVFSRIHLEFGNEMWGEASANDPFFGASALGGDRLGTIANERFALLRESSFYNPDAFNFIIGGQAYYPGRQSEIDRTGNNHNEIALAPYFGDDKQHANDDELFYPLFARPFQDVTTGRVKASQSELDKSGKNTGLAIYELNFHTTGGDSPIDITNDFVTGAGGALAMPLYMLVYQRDIGAKNQCAFTALQFSFGISDNRYVRVWGLLRDIAATARKRPTWLGLELVNRVMQGDMVAVDIEGARETWTQKPMNSVEEEIPVPYVHAFAYKKGNTRSLILFNLNLRESTPVNIAIEANGEITRHQLAPDSLHDDNEDTENVRMLTDTLTAASPLEIELPKHSISALQWVTHD